MLSDEGVIVKMGVCGVDAIDLFALAGTKSLLGIQAPNSLEQSLTAQHFVEPSNAAGVAVGRIKKGGVCVRDLSRARE